MHLFERDNFSRAQVDFKFVSATEAAALLPIVSEYFVDPAILSVQMVAGTGINSTNYKLTLISQKIEKTVLLRHCRFLKNSKQIKIQLSVLDFLNQHGVPVSSVLKTLRGETIVEREQEHYLLFSFVDGNYFIPTVGAYTQLATAVAHLHRGLAALPSSEKTQIAEFDRLNKSAYFNKITTYTVNDFLAIKERVVKNVESVLAVEFLKDFDFIVQTVSDTLIKKDAHKELPQQIIHADLHPHNILFNKEKVAVILDFDSLRPSQRARDVAAALYRFGRQFLAQGVVASIDAKACLTAPFLAAYQSANPLTDEELSLLPSLLSDQFLRQLLFVLRGVYFEGNTAWAADLPKFLKALHEIRYFF